MSNTLNFCIIRCPHHSCFETTVHHVSKKNKYLIQRSASLNFSHNVNYVGFVERKCAKKMRKYEKVC